MYTKAAKQATLNYLKNKQKQIIIRYKVDDYNNVIKPAIDKSGKNVASFIKEAIQEKIERENLLDSTTK